MKAPRVTPARLRVLEDIRAGGAGMNVAPSVVPIRRLRRDRLIELAPRRDRFVLTDAGRAALDECSDADDHDHDVIDPDALFPTGGDPSCPHPHPHRLAPPVVCMHPAPRPRSRGPRAVKITLRDAECSERA